jgi:hypothetical protein
MLAGVSVWQSVPSAELAEGSDQACSGIKYALKAFNGSLVRPNLMSSDRSMKSSSIMVAIWSCLYVCVTY